MEPLVDDEEGRDLLSASDSDDPDGDSSERLGPFSKNKFQKSDQPGNSPSSKISEGHDEFRCLSLGHGSVKTTGFTSSFFPLATKRVRIASSQHFVWKIGRS